MEGQIQFQVSPQTAADEQAVKELVRNEVGILPHQPFYIQVRKRSIDARGRKVRINITVYYADVPFEDTPWQPAYQSVQDSHKNCHIIGAGPAGLFAALRCLELGIKPIVIERGKDVRARRRDLAAINKEQIVNPNSNYCFGEGGAGTYSDGKLYTRSGKRGDIDKVLHTLVYHGASKEILIDAHPHIGTNKLPELIQNIRETLLKFGGEIHFNTKLIDLKVKADQVTSIVVEQAGEAREWPIQQVILATGHSARDIYYLLHERGILVEAKPFAMGVRAEHSQDLVDSIQYHCANKGELLAAREFLPAASYSLVHQVKGHGVYSFCMCPGGIIAPCATAQEEVVTNGWSPSKRNNPYANSGIVVGLELADFAPYAKHGPFAGLVFQQTLERNAWVAGGKTQRAPAQRLLDFTKGSRSATLPDCSYQPGIVSADVHKVLMPLIGDSLREGFKAFGGKMRGYLSNEAVVVGVESRTSTPVRIPRDHDTLQHPQYKNLFPCGEGAGYAGGIVSAAMDGERCADSIRD